MKKKSSKVTLSIKNMVCDRCIRVVREELSRLHYDICHVKLGEAVVYPSPSFDIEKVKTVLARNGFELIEDKKAKLVAGVKKVIIDLVHHSDKLQNITTTYSDYIEHEMNHEYHSLSKLFTSIEGTTIEKYFIAHKIEKVKELIVYGELTLNQISYQMGYSSVQHLSKQFKQVTGMTPSYFKKIKEHKRISIDKVK